MTENGFLWANFSILGKEKSHTGQDLVSTERVRALVFVLWLKSGGFFGTILAHTFFTLKCLTVSLSISSAIVLIPKRRSLLSVILTSSTFSSVLIVANWPSLASSYASSLSSEKVLCHSNTGAFDKSHITNWMFQCQFPSVPQKNFMLTSCLVFIKHDNMIAEVRNVYKWLMDTALT